MMTMEVSTGRVFVRLMVRFVALVPGVAPAV